jgi:hypothetical protein
MGNRKRRKLLCQRRLLLFRLRSKVMSRPTLEELGITHDTIIIEVEGGLIQEIYNDKVPIRIFDWDNIKADDNFDIDQEEKRLEDMLNAIRGGI